VASAFFGTSDQAQWEINPGTFPEELTRDVTSASVADAVLASAAFSSSNLSRQPSPSADVITPREGETLSTGNQVAPTAPQPAGSPGSSALVLDEVWHS
jgi:hypothetical protein